MKKGPKQTGPDLVSALGKPAVVNITHFLNDLDFLSFVIAHPKHIDVANSVARNRLLSCQSLESLQQRCKLEEIPLVELFTRHLFYKMAFFGEEFANYFTNNYADLVDFEDIDVPHEIKPVMDVCKVFLGDIRLLGLDISVAKKILDYVFLTGSIAMTGVGFSCLPQALQTGLAPLFQVIAIAHGQQIKASDLGENKHDIYTRAFKMALHLGHDKVAAQLLADKHKGLISFNDECDLDLGALLDQKHYSSVALLLIIQRQKSLKDLTSTVKNLQSSVLNFEKHSKHIFEHVCRYLNGNTQNPTKKIRSLEFAAMLGCFERAKEFTTSMPQDLTLDIQPVYNTAYQKQGKRRRESDIKLRKRECERSKMKRSTP